MEIYILRHGKAQERLINLQSDSKRQLTESGKKEMGCIAKAMKNLDIKVDDIFSSPLIRAKQTAEITLQFVKSKKKSITVWNELKPEIDVFKTIKKLTVLKPMASVLLVGHEPHLTNLVEILITDNPSKLNISLKKGGFIHIKGNSNKSRISGSLRCIMAPKQLKKLCN